VFFGRAGEIVRGIEIVRGAVQGTAARLALVLGASGSGKSSLLRAGVVPRLRREERLKLVGPFRPGPEPLDELAWEIASAFGVEFGRVAALAGHPPDAAVSFDRVVRQLLREEGKGHRHALCLIDQFEELLNRPQGHPSHAFLTLMQRALQSTESCVSFLGTMRSDQLPQLQLHPVARHFEWQTLLLGPLDAAGLREVIEGPARLAELELEAGLVDQMIADTPGPNALPLLALTLHRLHEHYGGDGLLQRDEYHRLGGVGGAVAKVAEDALAGVGEGQIEVLRDALLRMVRLDDHGTPVRQQLRWDELPEEAHPLLRRFIENRLLVSDRNDIRASHVQVAHEALFTAWSRLSDWIAEDRESLLVQQRVSQAARLWDEERDDSALWRGARLGRVLELWDAGRLRLGDAERAFLEASRHAEQTALEEKERRERERERLSRVALGRGLAYQALGEAGDRPQRGLLLAVEAVEAARPAGRNAVAPAENALRDLLHRFAGECLHDFGSAVQCLAVDPAAELLAVGCEDGTVGLVELGPDPGVPRTWRDDESAIVDVALADGMLATRARDGAVRVRDLRSADPDSVREYAPAATSKTVSALAPGVPLLAVAREGEPLRVHDLVADGSRTLVLDGAATRVLSFSPNSKWLADGREDGQVVLWDLSTLGGAPAASVIPAHTEAVRHIVWAAQGNCFVTTDRHGPVRRWRFGDAPGELSYSELPGNGSPILDLQLDAAGDLVVAGTWHREILCWTADDGFAQPVVLRGHTSSVRDVVIRVDGEWIATSSPRDNFALLWPTQRLRSEPEPVALRGEDRWLNRVAFLPDGTVVAASRAGTVRRWTRPSEEPWSLPIPGVDLNQYVLARDGMHLIAAGERMSRSGSLDTRGKFVSLLTERVESIDDPDPALAVAMTPDAGVAVIASADGVVYVNERSTGSERRLRFALDGSIRALAIDPFGRWLVASAGEGAPLLVDLAAGNQETRLGVHQTYLRYATFDGSGERLLTADAVGVVALWKRQGEGFDHVRSVQHDGVRWCAFRRDGAGWVSGSDESLLAVGPEADAGPLALELGWNDAGAKFALSRDAQRVVVGAGDRTASWDLAAAAPDDTRIELPRHEAYLWAVAVSADGSRIATSTVGNPVRLWNASAPTQSLELPRYQKNVMLLEFIDGDRRLVTGESGGSLALWDLDLDSMVARARRLAGRELTSEERARFLSL
jgi:WD40 repeat protein